ncbi:MAG: NAD-dependent epimerase/dehydratase family protein [Tepidisphaeraceae bacterium]|jgi:UDP-glucose 4-epimerase
MSKRYLVTGGAGFIGSHLTELLLARGHAVTVLDDFSTGRLSNLQDVAGNPTLQIIHDSVENEATVNIAIAACDAVFHLAAAVGVQLIMDQPVRTIRSIIHGTEIVLESARRFGRPVLITSSSEVYGKGAKVPFSEEDDVVVGPTSASRWCYAYSKGIDEFLGLAYRKQFGLPVVIVRLFNTVGPRQVGMYGMVLPRFVSAALDGAPLHVYGDGKQTRCFCHVADVTDALVRIMDRPAAIGQVFNLGSDQEISIYDLAQRVLTICGSSSRIELLSYEKAYGQRFDDLPRRVPKLDRIRSVIDFQPRYSLDQIIHSVKDSLAR